MQLDCVARLFDWRVLAWALMTNHFHLVLEVGSQGLAKGMHRLNLAFALASNERFERINHCAGSRYWSTPIESERHLDACIRYAVWNPARAGIVQDPLESTWTSLRASAGLDPAPAVLALDRLLSRFGRTPRTAQAEFLAYVLAGRDRCLAPFGDGAGIVR